MKTTYASLLLSSKFIWSVLAIMYCASVCAQSATSVVFNVTNLVQISSSEFRYDVYMTVNSSISGTTMKLRSYSWGLNTAIGLNQSTYITHSFVSRDSSLAILPPIFATVTDIPRFPDNKAATHLRCTMINAQPGNEVNLILGVPIRIATMRVNKVTTNGGVIPSPWVGHNINPFTNLGSALKPIQANSAAGKTQCVSTLIISPPGENTICIGTGNSPISGTLNCLTAKMKPSPDGKTPFLLNKKKH